MSKAHAASVLQHIRKLVDGSNRLGDAELLERFTSGRDEAAFDALLRRHGPLVLSVCQRVLCHPQDVEDAFQGTFLVLVRRAASIRKSESVSAWLYGVAYRIATKARTQAARRRQREALAGESRKTTSRLDEITGRELYAVVDEELNRLPAEHRAPLVLCYLEGKTRDEAARQLGWSLGTLKRRLESGRRRLHDRLTRRGLAPSFALFAATFSQKADATTVSGALTKATFHKALAFALGTTKAAPHAGPAEALANLVLKGIYMSKIKTALLFVIVCGSVAAGPGLMLRQSLVAQAAQAQSRDSSDARASAALTDQKEEKSARDGVGAKAAPYDTRSLARRVWAVLTTVEKNDIEPRARELVLSDGAKNFLKTAKVTAPAILPAQIAALNSEEKLAAFLKEVWPKPGAGSTVPDDKLEAAFLDGVLAGIPGKPDIMPPELVRVSEQSQANRYVGIGLMLSLNAKEKYPQIVTPIKRGPLHEAGARPSDLIVEVDGKNTHEVGLRKVVEWLRGEEGTQVTVVIQKPGEAARRTLHLTRSVVPFEMVVGYRRAGDGWTYRIDPATPVAYVRIDSITSGTLHELRQVEPQLRAEGVQAIVLDMRFTRGHSDNLHAASLVANGFLDGGLLWRVTDSHQQVKEYRASRECLFRHWPLAVLVNEDTEDAAHAAVAAALQDNGRAILVGEATKADGYATSVVGLPDQLGAISVRTSRLERAAKGRGWPVQPDHKVATSKAQRAAVAGWIRYKEFSELPAGVDEKPPEDPQLVRAVELLRKQIQVAERGSQGGR
jgi:C-terminal peptidase prc